MYITENSFFFTYTMTLKSIEILLRFNFGFEVDPLFFSLEVKNSQASIDYHPFVATSRSNL